MHPCLGNVGVSTGIIWHQLDGLLESRGFEVNRRSISQSISQNAERDIGKACGLISNRDRQEDIDALVKLLPPKISKVNLIPFNEYPESSFKKPSTSHIMWFHNELNRKGIVTTIRTTKGTDILAACGQLKSEYEKLNLWS